MRIVFLTYFEKNINLATIYIYIYKARHSYKRSEFDGGIMVLY